MFSHSGRARGFASGVAVEDVHHEPLAFFSGQFKGEQLRWPTVNKEAFAIFSGCQGGEWLRYEGVTTSRDDRILAYIFSPTVLVAELSKTTAQRG